MEIRERQNRESAKRETLKRRGRQEKVKQWERQRGKGWDE